MPSFDIAQKLAKVYANPALLEGTSDPDSDKWDQAWVDTIQVTREQYGSPVSMCGEAEIAKYIRPTGGPIPPTARVSAPILAAFSLSETEQGETQAKVAKWGELTSKFDIQGFSSDHMALPGDPKVVKLVVDYIVKAVQ